MSTDSTIRQSISSAPAGASAVGAPGQRDLTFGGLRRLMDDTASSLRAHGIGARDRVAIVLPNGPEMATSFLTIAAAASTAPLNPGYRETEFAFYLEDLRVSALLVEAGSKSPAVAAAGTLGIPVIRLHRLADGPAGLFRLPDPPAPAGGAAIGADTFPGPDHEALVLHTSGTTSRPKIVPLLQRNLTASARHIVRTLRLGPDDRCLNVMPLFHIHGLMACTLASLTGGGSVYCTPGFDVRRFYGWLSEAEATWYSAVPTMHQAILTRAAHNRDVLARAGLRFIRSSSSSLPPTVMAELEETFGVPVVEAYAMTEAAHQMTSNPLPPGVRKPGTVGPAAGPEVAVMGTDAELLHGGEEGEIVVRGPNVTPGYENNEAANIESFVNGWFRTGDLGSMDEDGYVTVSGRIKEIINRGGEKISPREVDEVLIEHPAIVQVVTFAVPHDMLGEDVAAAVVLDDGATASEQEIRAFAAERLAAFKVPRRILVMEEIPKGPTGKLRRIGLADQLGLGR